MGEFVTFWKGLDWTVLTGMLMSIVPVLLCLTIHELAHGTVAYALGDDTAKRSGRLTLNPLRHIDPMGLVMMLVIRIGWAKPVPVDMGNFKRPKLDMAITALAGPVSNFLLTASIFLFQVPLMRLNQGGGIGHEIAQMLITTAVISAYLGVFNLMPIPPLDGSKIMFSFLRDNHYNWLMRFERFGFIILMVLVWTGMLTGPLRDIMDGVVAWIAQLTFGPSTFLFS